MYPFFPSKKAEPAPHPAPHLPSPHSLYHPSQPPTHIPWSDGCFPRSHIPSTDQASTPRKCQAAEGMGNDGLSLVVCGSSCELVNWRLCPPNQPHSR